ncbi:MAG: DMT family transporter [Acidobacteriota bacterium]
MLATGLASAGFDLFQKLLARSLDPVPMVFLLGVASTPIFAVLVAVDGWPAISDGYWWPALGSTVLNLVGHVAFVQAVRISPLSVTVPLLSLTPVFTALLAIPILGEWPGRLGALGVGLVVVGAFWLHAGANDEPRRWSRLLREPGAWLMIGTAFAWSLSIPLDKLAVQSSAPTFHGLILTAGITLGAGVWLLPGRRILDLWNRPVIGDVRVFVTTLLLCTAALIFQLLALTATLASVVETGKRGIANLMALLFGRFVFDEPLDVTKWGAASVMAIGVALIVG